jgi:hypothetical protein
VSYDDGDTFGSTWTGTINIAGTNYTIASVVSPTLIQLTTSPGTKTSVDYVWNGGTLPSGNLNIGVFRSHYIQDKVQPVNGHYPCTGYTFQNIQITGGIKGGAATCLVDAGGDVGGSVFTVRQDVDFYLDFGVLGTPKPKEIDGLHQ